MCVFCFTCLSFGCVLLWLLVEVWVGCGLVGWCFVGGWLGLVDCGFVVVLFLLLCGYVITNYCCCLLLLGCGVFGCFCFGGLSWWVVGCWCFWFGGWVGFGCVLG